MEFAVIVIVALNFVFTVVCAVTTVGIVSQMRAQNSQNARLIGQLASIHEKIGETNDKAKQLNEKTEERLEKASSELTELIKSTRQDTMKENDGLKYLVGQIQKGLDVVSGRR